MRNGFMKKQMTELEKIIEETHRKARKAKLRRTLLLPYNALKSSILCLRFPFLYPRNRWTGKHYTNWKILRYHQDNWTKAYEWVGLNEEKNSFSGKWKVTNKWLAFKINFLNGFERFLGIFHIIPSYTELDAMPIGWRKCFGIQMCKEIKQALLENGGRKALRKYRITQIKEKWGELRWYDFHSCQDVWNVIDKYAYISRHTCIECGRIAKYMSKGYICPYCEKCIGDKKDSSDRFFSDIPFYGVTNGEYYEKHKNDKNNEE